MASSAHAPRQVLPLFRCFDLKLVEPVEPFHGKLGLSGGLTGVKKHVDFMSPKLL